jgi:hypothetical protein
LTEGFQVNLFRPTRLKGRIELMKKLGWSSD